MPSSPVGGDIAGANEAAMGTASKQITSIQRYVQDLKPTFGEGFTEVLTVAAMGLTAGLKDASGEVTEMSKNGQLHDWGRSLLNRAQHGEFAPALGDCAWILRNSEPEKDVAFSEFALFSQVVRISRWFFYASMTLKAAGIPPRKAKTACGLPSLSWIARRSPGTASMV